MPSSPIRNIIFDFGGVLFEIDYHLPIEAFKELGFEDFGSIYTQAAQSEIFDRLETGRISNEEFMAYIHSFVSQASREEVDHAWNCILLHLMPEKVAFVQEMRDQGFRTFMLSNTNAIHVAEFEKMIEQSMGLEEFRKAFEKIYYSNAIGIKKPYSETYLQVCEWNGLNPSETLFIDDSIQHVLGAEKAGLHVLHLQPGQDLATVVTQKIAVANS